MTDRLFIALGVHAPKGMEVLPGVDTAVTKMADYARANPSYAEPIVFSDRDNPVHAMEISAALTPELLANRPRVVVHFCGHGAQLNGNEIWYLTDGLDQWMDRVNVIQFRDMILSHGASQVCIFSDACQTPASDLADGTPLIRKGNRAKKKSRTDMFRATLKGKPAFAALDGGPLFSGAVLAALGVSPPPKAALSEAHLGFKRFVVSSDSLSDFVQDLLPDEAAGVRKQQYAQMSPTLKFGEDDYVIIDPEDAPPEWRDLFPKTESASIGLASLGEPQNGAMRSLGTHSPEDKDHILEATQSEWRQAFWAESRQVAVAAHAQGSRIVALVPPQARAVVHTPDGHELPGIKLDGNYVSFDVAAPSGVLEVEDVFTPLQLGSRNDLVMALAAHDPSDGVNALGWHEVPGEAVGMMDPMRALKGLTTGTLGPRDVGLVAAEVQLQRHVDPLYGTVTAYLLDQMGDTDAIRRLCAMYARQGQDIPFDIAMLARLSFRKDGGRYLVDLPAVPVDHGGDQAGLPDAMWRETEALPDWPVAGFTPMLLMGWGRIETIFDASSTIDPLPPMRRLAAPVAFPSFHGAHGRALINAMVGVGPASRSISAPAVSTQEFSEIPLQEGAVRLAFIHGINNEQNTAETLEAEWWQAITEGWADLGLPPKPKPKIDVGYYGKVLANAAKGIKPEVVAQGDETANRSKALAFLQTYQDALGVEDADIRDEMANMGHIEEGVVAQGWIQRSLVAAGSAVERVLRGRGQWLAGSFLPQATHYIEDPGLAAQIALIVRKAIFDDHDEPSIVVSHSLGTVVAYDLLMDERQDDRDVPLFLTLGSPLAIGMMEQILPNREDVPNTPIKKWTNAYRLDDPVTLGRGITQDTLGIRGVENINQGLIERFNTHSPTAYLRSPPVCARIHAALP
ncbi:MAG: hypothetical protein AAGA87_04860 [Pseudomonadota bacterium]